MISSTRNPWIKALRLLHQAKGRRQHGCFLVEGTHLLQEAIATGWPLSAVCFTEAWAQRNAETLARVPANARQQVVDPQVLDALATTQTPDGVVAVAERKHPGDGDAKVNLAIALETVGDPGNAGAIVRTAAAAGSDRVWLSADSVDPEHPKVLRASAGQWFRLPPQVAESLPDLVVKCRDRGMQVLAAAMPREDEPARICWEVDFTRPTLLLLGNEGAGLSRDLVRLADACVQIPMAAGVESLNVAIAGSVLLYEARRQRWAAENAENSRRI
ncbi:MAG: RNA methyltransferase [Cyanobacteria bacterium J06648_11]